MQYSLYRFIDSCDNIIYVGQSANYDRRRHQHFGGTSGHLDGKVYMDTVRLEYLELDTDATMFVKEIYYINKWKPKYNTRDKGLGELQGIIVDESADEWKVDKDFYITKLRSLEVENKELRSEAAELRQVKLYLETEVQSKDAVLNSLNVTVDNTKEPINVVVDNEFSYGDVLYLLYRMDVRFRVVFSLNSTVIEYVLYSYNGIVYILVDGKAYTFEGAKVMIKVLKSLRYGLINSADYMKVVEKLRERGASDAV